MTSDQHKPAGHMLSITLVFSSGVLLQVAYSFPTLGVVVFFALCPALWVVSRQSATFCIISGAFLGLLHYADAPFAFASWGPSLILGPWFFAAAVYALFLLLTHYLMRSLRPPPSFFAAPIAWLFVSTISDKVFQLPLTFSLALVDRYPELIGAVRVIGSEGADILIVTFSSVLASTMRLGRKVVTVVLIFVSMAALSHSLVSSTRLYDLGAIPLYLLQPAADFSDIRELKDVSLARYRHEQHLDAMTEEAVASSAGLVVWPEGGNRLFNNRLARRESIFYRMLGDKESEVLVAGLALDDDRAIYNVVQLYTRNGFVDQAAKNRVVPVSESQLTSGKPTVLETRFGMVGIAICFDSLFKPHAQALVDQGAQVIVTTSDDSSFGPAHMTHWHAAYSVLRGIEVGRPVVFLSNDGPALVADRAGNILHRSATNNLPAVYAWHAPISGGTTWFSLGGKHTAWVFAFLCLMFGYRPRLISTDTRTGQTVQSPALLLLLPLILVGLLLNVCLISLRQEAGLQSVLANAVARRTSKPINNADFAYFKQTYEKTGGASALAYTLSRLGDHVSEKELYLPHREEIAQNSLRGLYSAAASRAFDAQVVRNLSWDTVLVDVDSMDILLLKSGRFIVALHRVADELFYFDPKSGVMGKTKPSELLEHWHGIALRVSVPERM